MKAIWNGATLAESDDTIVVEGNQYFPLASLDEQYVRPSDHTTVCPWKGTARYFDVVVNGDVNPTAIWTYPEPTPEAEHVRDRVAFWKGVEVQ